jgi:hypothetical protein
MAVTLVTVEPKKRAKNKKFNKINRNSRNKKSCYAVTLFGWF